MDFIEQFFDNLGKNIEKAERVVDDFFDAVDRSGIAEKFNDLREDLTMSEEEREFKRQFRKYEEEEYGPKEETSLLKELMKKKKERDREEFDELVDPDSSLGQVVHTVRRAIDREEEKMENRTKAAKNLFYTGTKKDTFNLADHIFVRSGFITHHGIYVGGGRVVHFAPVDGEYIVIGIHEVTLEEFAKGREIRCLNSESPMKYSREEAVRRAYSRVGNEDYDFFGNNCESFVRWCRCGDDEDVWKYE